MGINCALLVAVLFLFCYEKDFMRYLQRKRNDMICSYVMFCYLGSVGQSIVSLTTLLRRQFVKFMLTMLSNPLLFLVETNVRIFCTAKDSHIFCNKK